MPAQPFPEFSASEVAQAQRINQWLRYSPRFRAPTLLGRAMIQTLLRTSALAPHGVRGVTVSTRRIEWKGQSASLRILQPPGPLRGVYVDYHGGGWAIGTASMDDRVNACIARDCGLAVVSVDYQTLPDVDLPSMIAQCAVAADWAFERAQAEFGASDMFIGGESAGAHLAMCSILRLRERGDFARLKGAVLFYGPYDLSCTPSVKAATRDTLVLNGPAMTAGIAKLLPGRSQEERRAPDVSPLYADLHDLPPVLLLCGAIDPLIDDSRLMAERWQGANGNARLMIAPEAPHAFNRLATRIAFRTNAFVRAWIGEHQAATA